MAILVRFESPIFSPRPTAGVTVIPPKKERRLEFENLPGGWVHYERTIDLKDQDQYTETEVTDAKTKTTGKVYLENQSLFPLGLSPSTWRRVSENKPEKLTDYLAQTWQIHTLLLEAGEQIAPYLAQRHLTFIPEEDIPLVTRFISDTLASKAAPVRISKKGTSLPVGFSIFNYPERSVILDIKKSCIGRGGFCKVKAGWWLDKNELVARKKLVVDDDLHDPTFELQALNLYRNQIGIISYICANRINGSWFVVFPYFENSLSDVLKFGEPYSLKNRLCIAGQLLKGLAIISETGIHGDIKPSNVVLEDDPIWGVEANLIDFGSWRPSGQGMRGITTLAFTPPEYYNQPNVTPEWSVTSESSEELECSVTSESSELPEFNTPPDLSAISNPGGSPEMTPELSPTSAPGRSPEFSSITESNSIPGPRATRESDVWRLGIVLHLVLGWHLPPRFTRDQGSKEMATWLSSLKTGWIHAYETRCEIPSFALSLIDAMLDPDPSKRPSAKRAFDLFWKGLSESEELSPLALTPPFSLLAPPASESIDSPGISEP